MVDITCISDTHGFHDSIELISGDILVHCGDWSNYGTYDEIIRFRDWFESQPFRYRIFICGNHEVGFEENKHDMIKLFQNSIYLEDSGVEVLGINFWGSPRSLRFGTWAYQLDKKNSYQQWSKIPQNTDVLITHGPPYGVLDHTFRGELVGDTELYNRTQEIGVKYHLFGHIHEQYGELKYGKTNYINCAIWSGKYKYNSPIRFSYE